MLDRPNPITGSRVEGPLMDAANTSFVGYFAGMPARHGMTMGELARLFNAQNKIGANLTVVAMEDWRRGDWFDSTGLGEPLAEHAQPERGDAVPGPVPVGIRKRISVPNRSTKSPARRQYQKQRWFKKGQKWRTGCEGRISLLKRRRGLRRSLYKKDAGMKRRVGLGVIADNPINLGTALAK